MLKVFISWSGERSKQVGELLVEWLKCVLQASEPWISTEIDRGAFWLPEISKGLEESANGIICLTKENINKPWILFEAGALAKGISANRVCTFLVDLEPKDIEDPLAQFNHTLPQKEDMKKLVRTLNARLCENSLPDKILESVFTTYWNQFEEKFKMILESTHAGDLPVRDDNDMLQEVLYAVRSLSKRFGESETLTDVNIYNNRMRTSSNSSSNINNIAKSLVSEIMIKFDDDYETNRSQINMLIENALIDKRISNENIERIRKMTWNMLNSRCKLIETA